MTSGSAIEAPRWVFHPPPLSVVGFQVAASGTFCILEDGRMYERVMDEWRAFQPPLTKAQREAR